MMNGVKFGLNVVFGPWENIFVYPVPTFVSTFGNDRNYEFLRRYRDATYIGGAANIRKDSLYMYVRRETVNSLAYKPNAGFASLT